MKYRGYEILPVYFTGSNCRFFADGRCVDRKPTSKDVEYYRVVDPLTSRFQEYGCSSIGACKTAIDGTLKLLGLKSNLPKEWAKLDDHNSHANKRNLQQPLNAQ